MIEIGRIPKGDICPRCGSTRTYHSSEDFFCLTCSLIVLEKLDYNIAEL